VITVAPAAAGVGDAQPGGSVEAGGVVGEGIVVVGTVVVGGDAEGDALGSLSLEHAPSASRASAPSTNRVLRIRGPSLVSIMPRIVQRPCDSNRATIGGVRRSLALAAASVALATSAWAHSPARIRVASPGDGARVTGDSVRVVLVGEGGDSAATFRLDLDGRAVDATGRIGGVFSTLSVRPNQQITVEVPVDPGEHTLTVTPNPDVDSDPQPVVHRFSVVADTPGSGGTALVLAGLAVAGAVGAAVAVRRRAGVTADAD
jgi:hypothetical protein